MDSSTCKTTSGRDTHTEPPRAGPPIASATPGSSALATAHPHSQTERLAFKAANPASSPSAIKPSIFAWALASAVFQGAAPNSAVQGTSSRSMPCSARSASSKTSPTKTGRRAQPNSPSRNRRRNSAAPPTANRHRYVNQRVSQIAASRTSELRASAATGGGLRVPTEYSSRPATGRPSCDRTRQPNRYVPATGVSAGSLSNRLFCPPDSTVRFTCRPLGSNSRAVVACTGPSNWRLISCGARDRTAPAAGELATNAAWPNAT
ncbi:hypothetical protein CDEF62S_03458 [Castellaniella defragrans]